VVQCGVGWLSLQLAGTAGYATPIYPAAGIALGALLVFGYALTPGVFLGALALNLILHLDGSDLNPSIWLTCLGLASATTLQASFGCWLIRHFTSYKKLFESIREILLFQVLGAPIACLFAATTGPSILYTAGTISYADLYFETYTWWIGDSIGVLIFTPLVLAIWEPAWRENGRRWIPIVAPLLITLTLVASVFYHTGVTELKRVQEKFQRQASIVEYTTRKTFNLYLESLYAIESFYESTDVVEEGEFSSFVERSFDRHPGLQALEWAPLVRVEDRATFLREARVKHPQYTITQLDEQGRLIERPDQAEMLPIRFAEPIAGNERALGYDLMSNPIRGAAAHLAWQSGRAAMTAPVRLIQKSDDSRAAVLIFLPIFRSAVTQSNTFAGCVVGVLDVEKIVDDVLDNLPVKINFSITLTDRGDRAATNHTSDIFYTSNGSDAQTEKTLKRNAEINLAKRTWHIEIRALPGYLSAQRDLQGWIVFAGGLLFSGLMGTFLLSNNGNTIRIERQVEEKTRTLQSVVGSLERSNKDLKDFAYVASHDLREPLRTVKSYMELIEDQYQDQLDEEGRMFIRFCREGAERMHKLVTGLLEYSRIGTHVNSYERFGMESVIDEVSKNLNVLMHETKTIIEYENLPHIFADRLHIVQLMQNLISNAIKYQHAQQPHIVISAERSGNGWRFNVMDNGIGIAERHQARIFTIFQRLHTREEYEGTGIGLSVCKRIVQQHDGEIWVSSEEDEGSTFSFRIPDTHI
jgi:signal transduction histidine kinase